ncbi:MAG: glucose-1-phosphate adenylyltransferase subunit GlgD [Defluviitaleaceae bacterium]|nr:glucose-1-phosphate adenylyltransferase subunit GlgD [Defluviitaleaceae bacterium]
MRALGIILAGGNNEKLGVLTQRRAVSALPVGSCYRAVDFTLSNMTNSGINKVAVITQYHSRSLHDHLSSSTWWNFGRKQGGLFIFTPYVSNEGSLWFRGTADSMYKNLIYLKRSNEPYVVIASGNAVYKMDFNKLIDNHIETEADITVVYKDIIDEDFRNYGAISFDETGRLFNLEEKPFEKVSDQISLGIYVIKRTLLIKILESIIPEERYDFVKDVLIGHRKMLKIMGYKFDGYWRAIDSVDNYLKLNMEFLQKDVRTLLIKDQPYIETKPKDEPPVKYNYAAAAKNCLVGSGSIINGNVQNSVLFRRVYTGENSLIKNSVIMEGCYIGNNCIIQNVILDKEVVISEGKSVIGTPEEPAVVAKGEVV